MLVLVAACGTKRGDSELVHQSTTSGSGGDTSASSGGPMETNVGEADGTATSTNATGSAEATHGGETSSESGSSTTVGENPPLYELCPTATDETGCVDLNPRCRWFAIHEVLSIETCEVSEPTWGCWAMVDPDGPQGCFGYYPTVCQDAGVAPAYRVADGVTQVADIGTCQNLILLAPDEPQWVVCPDDEFQTPPPECYCLCN